MRKLVALLAVSSLALLGLVMPASPASAEQTAVGAAVFAGTANTSGTWLPVSPFCGSIPCNAANSWSFSSNIADAGVIVQTNNGTPTVTPILGTNNIAGGGTFTGWCGLSTGSGGFAAGPVSGTVVAWVSVGGTIVLVGTLNGYTASGLVATVQARPLPGAGTAPCVDHPATTFLVVGAAAVGGASV